MPTRHYSMTATPADALARLRTAALASGWHVDTAASTATALTLKRDADEKTWGWSTTITVTGDDDGVTSLVATTDDAPHDSDYLRESGALHTLFHGVGATKHAKRARH